MDMIFHLSIYQLAGLIVLGSIVAIITNRLFFQSDSSDDEFETLSIGYSWGKQVTLSAYVEDPNTINDLHDNTYYVLHIASALGDIDSINALLNKGADIDLQDEKGQTALMAATLDSQFDSVNLLLSRGANPDLEDVDGKTALKLATDSEIIAMLSINDV